LHLAYLKDPELWLALGLFVAFVIIGKWLSNKVFGKAGAANEGTALTAGKGSLSNRHA
jgi:hypothetical protein